MTRGFQGPQQPEAFSVLAGGGGSSTREPRANVQGQCLPSIVARTAASSQHESQCMELYVLSSKL